jgi:Legionella pneumophila major outer membrane protein precursor
LILVSIFKKIRFFLLLLISFFAYATEYRDDFSNRMGLNISIDTDRGLKCFADILYWKASEETSSIWATIGSSSFNPLISDKWEAKNISFNWDYGLRFGVGYNLSHDKWETRLLWSWFRTKSDSEISNTSSLILPQFFGAFVNGDQPFNGNLRWSILYNMGDLELARTYWISKKLSFCPYVSLKGGWIYQKIRSLWQVDERDVNNVKIPVNYIAEENLKNNFWGIGPCAGFQTMWTLANFKNQALQLLGNFSSALLWGNWSFKDEYFNQSPYRIDVNVRDLHLGALMLKGILGFGWKKCWNKAFLAANIGYEAQLWINQLRIPTFQQILLHGDLTLQGGIFNVEINF